MSTKSLTLQESGQSVITYTYTNMAAHLKINYFLANRFSLFQISFYLLRIKYPTELTSFRFYKALFWMLAKCAHGFILYQLVIPLELVDF